MPILELKFWILTLLSSLDESVKSTEETLNKLKKVKEKVASVISSSENSVTEENKP